MIGRGSASAGVSVRNALFDGLGAAVGIELFARATVELEPAGGSEPPLPDRSLVGLTAQAALTAWSGGHRLVRVRIDSEIPVSRGLKSSSAVASAVERAVLAALRRTATGEEVARLGAITARTYGFSATGAFDDALAGLVPGIHVTDNWATRPLQRLPPPRDSEVILWIPPGRHALSPSWRTAFSALRAQAAPAREALLSGDWSRAMELNSELVERVLGYDYGPLRRRVRGAGATAAGVSGMGPAFAIVAPTECLGPVLRALPHGGAEIIVTRFLRRVPEVAG